MSEFLQELGQGGSPRGMGATFSDCQQGEIGLQLRAVFELLVTESVPFRFIHLLDQMDARAYT